MSLRLDEWERRRGAADRALDARLVALGFKVGYRHVSGCAVGTYRGAPCTCREVAAAREARRRRGVLTR